MLVGAETIEQALAEAEKCRIFWPASKIMLLMGPAGADDYRQMMASEIDGCVPLSVSRDTLLRTLDLMMLEDAKILLMVGPSSTRIQPLLEAGDPQHDKEHQNGNGGRDMAKISIMHMASPALACVNGGDSVLDSASRLPRSRTMPRLSERETQILDGIVCGYSNKVIARTCGITEATVKVHMKSILRKIHVANRTQAAVWAMENNYTVRMEKHLLEVDTDGAAA
ncbi:MAG TPA: LuxR C-terminal-related transcriptional regulator [Pseudolabrys sp.]|nr:LuxR C-terminal-related transcriptional regulator [Pseudolabrys sp.]